MLLQSSQPKSTKVIGVLFVNVNLIRVIWEEVIFMTLYFDQLL